MHADLVVYLPFSFQLIVGFSNGLLFRLLFCFLTYLLAFMIGYLRDTNNNQGKASTPMLGQGLTSASAPGLALIQRRMVTYATWAKRGQANPTVFTSLTPGRQHNPSHLLAIASSTSW